MMSAGTTNPKPVMARWRELPVELLLMTLLCVCSVYPFISALDLALGFWSVAFTSLLLLALLSVIMRSPAIVILSSIAVLAVTGAAAAILLLSGPDSTASPLRDDVYTFLNWAFTYLKGYRVENPLFKHILATGFIALIALPVCLFTVRRFDAMGAVLPGIACFSALFVIGHVINMPSLFGFILAGSLYFFYGSYKKTSAVSSDGAKHSPALFLMSALPAAVAVMAIAIVSSSMLMIDPAWMKTIRDKVLQKDDSITQYVVKPSTDTVSPSELGGVPLLDDTVLMEVISSDPSVYLRGTSKDIYTGHSWEQSDTTPSIFYANSCNFNDTVETVNATPLKGEYSDQVFSNSNITVKYTCLRTSVLYLPLKTISISGIANSTDLSLIGSDIVMIDKGAQNRLEYSVDFLQPVNQSAEFKSLADKCYSGFYIDNRGLLQDRDLHMASDAAVIAERYTRLPPGLPTRVRDLALQITAPGNTEYEKAKAIEQYLSQNYTYTLTPGAVDKTKDFVDQFLFESKKGYCTYFATAMAVMLRCAGIPSRYVEGYVLPSAPKDPDRYLVTKRQGHAWAEAYFEGLGWLNFEPTSAYSNGARPTFSPTPTATATPAAEPIKTPEPAEPDTEEASSRSGSDGGFLLPLCLIVSAALTALVYGVHISAGRRIAGLSPRDATMTAFEQCSNLLSKLGVAIENGEALPHFAQRAEKFAGLPPRSFLRATEAFQLARYSTHEITGDHKTQMLASRNELLKACRKKLGPVRYLYYKWIWG